MAETTVTFLTYDPTSVQQPYTQQLRVFDLEISADAQSYYIQCMNAFDAVINDTTLTDSDKLVKMGDILHALDTWSQYIYVSQGQQITQSTATIDDVVSSGDPITLSSLGTMDRYMAESVDKLIRTFRAAGYDPVGNVFTKSGVTNDSVYSSLFVTDADLYDVAGTLTQAINAAQQCRLTTDVWTQSQSIQQLLMVDYVSRGNELLFNEMSQLKTAIDLNQSTLAYLNSLQDLMNQKDPQHFIMALQNLSGTVGGDVTKYESFESDSYNQELSNVAKFSDTDVESYLKNILGLDPTATPTPSQLTGTALGAFQPLSDANLTNTLDNYLSTHNISATMETLLPDLSANSDFSKALSTFATTNNLSTDDQTLIWRAFLVREANPALPSTVDLTSSSVLSDFNAFLTSLGTVSSSTLEDVLQTNMEAVITPPINPVSWLTTLPDVNLNQYLTLLNNQFSDSAGFSDADRLNIWKAYLMANNYTADQSFGLTSTDEFTTYLGAVTPLIGSNTGDGVVNALYTYLYTPKTALQSFSPENSVANSTVSLPTDPSSLYQVTSLLDTYFPTSTYSSEDQLNVWRAFLVFEGVTDPNASVSPYLFENFLSHIDPYLTAIGKSGAKGDALLSALELYAFLPPGTSDQQATVIDQLNTAFPSPATDEARRNFLKGFLLSQGHQFGSDFTLPLSTQFDTYVTSIQGVLGSTPATGQNMINAINSYNYSVFVSKLIAPDQQDTYLLNLFSASLPAQVTVSDDMDTTLGTTDLTDDQKFQIWFAFVSAQAGSQSLMQVDMTSETNVTAFQNFLTAISTDDLGASIDTRISRIIENLQYLIDQLTQVDSASSLAQQLQVLVNDFQGLVDSGAPLSQWVEDYATGSVGNYQKNLNDTIVASQSLNDTEREQLRQVMFVYEEFYKSATAMLSRLTQLIEKMASAINR